MTAPDVVDACGGDAELADAAAAHPGATVRFAPDATSDLARALGMTERRGSGAATVDFLHIDGTTCVCAVNMAVLGPPPDRLGRRHRRRACRVEGDGRVLWDGPATTVVLANGEFLRGTDLVPRGHPADGRFEVHVYALRPGQRRLMRARLATGEHVPHPGIHTASVRQAVVRFDQPVRVEIDGRRHPRAPGLEVALDPARLVVRFMEQPNDPKDGSGYPGAE
jgi:YegS C-terminal NAD kinase beta sandwich-like domain